MNQPSAFDQAVALYQQGKFQEALAVAKQGLAEFANVAGAAAQGLGSVAEAQYYWHTAIEARPDFANAYYNLANLLKAQGRLSDAEATYRRALALNPQLYGAYNNLGNLLKAQGRLEEAEAAYRQALLHHPHDADTHNNLATLLHESGRLAESLAAYRQAIACKSDHVEAVSQLLHQSRHACDWRELAPLEMQVRAFVRAAVAGVSPFGFITLPSTPAEQLVCARLWTQRKVLVAVRPALAPPPARRHTKIRLGYLSADFREHATAYLMAELVERHDRQIVEIIAYAYGPDDASPMRSRLIRAFDRFVDIRDLSDAAAAARIRADEVDILVDLKGYTHGARTAILAHRPAPIQVNYLGYPGTLGAPFIDYLIADAFVVPAAHQPFYSETLVHLPDCYQPNDSRRAIAARTPSRAECGLPETGFVFCCFNNNYKITPEFFTVWMRLLEKTPGSVLWLLQGNALACDNLRREAAARGIDPERLVFAPRLPLAEHLARHRLADLFLDTLPYNAHTTASDALWAGLPMLTCAGETFAARVGGSLLKAVGLAELITDSPTAYEALALRLAHEPRLLAGLRAHLAANRSSAPLFDSGRYTRHLEIAYQRMWGHWCAGLRPEPFAVRRLPHES